MDKVKLENVSSVYNGRNNTCCCGCAGTHTYASAHRKWASKNRGYVVEDDEVNDAKVKRIVNKINNNMDKLDIVDSSFVSVVVGTRLYIAYFKKEL